MLAEMSFLSGQETDDSHTDYPRGMYFRHCWKNLTDSNMIGVGGKSTVAPIYEVCYLETNSFSNDSFHPITRYSEDEESANPGVTIRRLACSENDVSKC